MPCAKIKGIWHGDILSFDKMDETCQIDAAELARAPRLNLEVQYDTTDLPKRAMLVIRSEFDTDGHDADVTNIPAYKTTGVLDLACLDVPKYGRYRSPGFHVVDVEVYLTTDTVIWKFIRAITLAKLDDRVLMDSKTFTYRVTGKIPEG